MTNESGGQISLKEHYDALRAADERLRVALEGAAHDLREAIRVGDLALQAERVRSADQLEVSRATALAAALLAVKEKNEVALLTLEKQAALLAQQTIQDKKAANEWRGTVNDIISKMGGARMLWLAIAGAIGMGFLIWNQLRHQ